MNEEYICRIRNYGPITGWEKVPKVIAEADEDIRFGDNVLRRLGRYYANHKIDKSK
jgi:hypothetical protein